MTPEEPAKEVILKAREGDHDAFSCVVKAYETIIYNLAYRLCRDRAEAWDMAQDAFLRVFENFGKYDPALPFRPWLLKVAANVCLNRIRGRRRLEPTLTDIEDPDGERMTAAVAMDPARAAENRDTAQRVREAVAALPPDYRVIVVLRYLQGLSYEEIAATLDLALGTVKNRLFRARDALKERLKRFEEAL